MENHHLPVRKPSSKAIIVLSLVVLVTLVWLWRAASDPRLRGKSLGAWLDQYYEASIGPGRSSAEGRQRREEAGLAVKEMGANALPALLARVRARDSSAYKRLVALARKQSLVKIGLRGERLRNRADWGFAILGPVGKPAVPELTSLLRNDDPEVRQSAARCLGHIGPEAEAAIPDLMPLLAERNYGLCILSAMDALRDIHGRPEVVVPAMLEFLNGSRKEWNYASPAMNVLRSYGTRATSAAPAIVAYLTHPDADKRNIAESALNAIDPDALARVGEKP